MYIRALLLSIGLLACHSHIATADSLEFLSPAPNSLLVPGAVLPLTYKVHHAGMAQLMWAKLHLMTEDGRDAGTGTLNTAIRSEWQDSHGTVSSRFTVPGTLPAGKYVLHVYGSTLQPCEGSTDSTLRCEGVLSETLPVEITSTGSRTDTSLLTSSTVVHLPLRKRKLFAGRGLLGPHGRGASPDAQLLDGRMDTKKMLYFFSLI